MEPSRKRRQGATADDGEHQSPAAENGRATPRSLEHPISPPRKKNKSAPSSEPVHPPGGDAASKPQVFRSPFQLTWIRDAPADTNVDAVTLHDLLGDPLIAECWDFNYLHDIDFLMKHFDNDTRHLVTVHVVHGFWKREDENRLFLQQQASQYKNVSLHSAPMPEMFGTHHTKMLVLLRHDDTAQVVIHTANMIARDWTNMTQAVWRSPLLPLRPSPPAQSLGPPSAGSGEKFKVDLLNYLRAYDQRWPTCRPLVDALSKHDFSAVRGALIASVPGRHQVHDDSETRWGWAALKQTLRSVPVQDGPSEVVVQISSIATLGPTDAWLQRTLFDSLGRSKNGVAPKPAFKVVFPTPDEIRKSLDGYEAGGSIHTKIQSAQQVKQLQYLRPMFCHWANDSASGKDLGGAEAKDGGRKRAAPHIKTYIRYGRASIDWALVTSANLSKQAWGEAANPSGETRIASWELGVLVWPSLFAEDAKMVGTFRKGTPDAEGGEGARPVVGLRIPYDLPLQPYGAKELPWVATASYSEPDWKGRAW